MGIWDLGSVYDTRWKNLAPNAPTYVSAGNGIATSSGTTNYVQWNHWMANGETCVIAAVSVTDSTIYQGPDERVLTATVNGQPMALIGYQDKCAVFLGFTDPTVAGTKYIRVAAPVGSSPNYYWAGNSVAFTGVDGATNLVTNPNATTSYPSTTSTPLTATLTSAANSISVFCVGVWASTSYGSLTGGSTERFWVTGPSGGSSVGLFTQTGTGSSQSFSINPYNQGSVVAFSLIWTP